MAEKRLKRPRDPFQLAKLIGDTDGHKAYLTAVEDAFGAGVDVSPAMAAGVSDKLWSMADIVQMIEEREFAE